jgi:hypothetical protein
VRAEEGIAVRAVLEPMVESGLSTLQAASSTVEIIGA